MPPPQDRLERSVGSRLDIITVPDSTITRGTKETEAVREDFGLNLAKRNRYRSS